jgi:hypothetical protein
MGVVESLEYGYVKVGLLVFNLLLEIIVILITDVILINYFHANECDHI